MKSCERLIVALDTPERAQALRLAHELREHVGLVKVGLEPFVAFGPGFVRELVELGLPVFLDLKIHDIPRTAAAAVKQAKQLGATMVTVHASGGKEMIAASSEAAADEMQVIAVTLLTSMDEAAVEEVGFKHRVTETAKRLGELALSNGAHGLVCSAHELDALSKLPGTRVVPGIRPAGVAAFDQRRTATPKSAIERGATWLVVGRPIVAAEDPAAAARRIVEELGDASK